MIEKLEYTPTQLHRKINEIIDAVNEISTWRFDCDDETRAENVRDKAEQRKWIGCVCRFWYDNPDDTTLDYLGKIQTGENGIVYYGKETYDWFPHCEPILPTDDAIYKGGDNE